MPDAEAAQDVKVSLGLGAGLVSALALLVTLLMAAPVIRSPSERIFGSGEILSRADPNRDALVVIDQFRTGRVPSPYLQPLTDLPGRAMARLFGPVAAYNLLVLVTFPLAALAAYLLARHLSISHPGAMVAGLAYAFLPFHVMQAGGHPHIAQTQWLPLFLLALWRCIDRPDPTRIAFMLLAAAAAALADFYGGFIIAVLSPIALLAYGIGSSRSSASALGRRMGATALALFVAAIMGMAAIRVFAPSVATNPLSAAFARSDLFAWSARWWSPLVPPADHPIWGSAVRAFWGARGVGLDLLEHQQLSLSLALVALSLVPLWRFARGGNSQVVRIAPALAAVGIAALLCSLSPERQVGSFMFVRPSAFLYEIAPMFRAYARFGGVVGLMTSLLAGIGVACLWPSRPGRRALAALLGIAILENAPLPPWRSRDVLPTAAHRFVSAQAGPMNVLDCVPPVRVSDTLAAPLLGHPLSFLGGRELDDCGEPGLGDKLRGLGYTHVIVRRDTPAGAAMDEDSKRFAPRGALVPKIGFRDAWLFGVPAAEPPARLGAWSGFHEREYDQVRTWRWMGQVGTLSVVTSRASPLAVVEVDLRAFPGIRRVDWSLNGQPRGEIEVTAEWSTHALRLGALEAGEVALTLSCREPAVVADGLLHNRDPRALGLAVGMLRISHDRN